MREQISVAKVFGQTLVELGRKDDRIFVLDADLARSCGTDLFATEFPDRHIQVGLAEQNMIGISAGLAASGKIPFANTFGVFASRRVADQVAISVALNRFNVKICGSNSGLTSSLNGATHQAMEDVAIMRAFAGMVVVDPADTLELAQAVVAIAEYEGPVYLRMARGTVPRCVPDDHQFALGKAAQLRDGSDVTLVGSGIMTAHVLDAAEVLAADGIRARVLNVSTIKPLDREAILRAAEETGAIVTAENHTVTGGLGSAVCELLADEYPTPVKRIGVQDRPGDTAPLDWLLEKYEMTPTHIAEAARQVIRRKRSVR